MVRFEKFEIWHTRDSGGYLQSMAIKARATSRARDDVARTRTSLMTSQSLQSLNLNLVAISIAMGLSLKPCGRFPSFFACKLICMTQPYTAKINRIRSISMDLEGFCITMATLLDFSKILLSRDVTGPAQHVHVRFRSDPSRNRDGVRARGHKPYCFYSMIS